jgi:hypothetical protein
MVDFRFGTLAQYSSIDLAGIFSPIPTHIQLFRAHVRSDEAKRGDHAACRVATVIY